MTTKQKIKYHKDNNLFCKITRDVGESNSILNGGYIIDYSKDFVLMQECDEFSLLGYLIFPIKTISNIRFNKNDKYYHKIMKWEKQIANLHKKHEINLNDWSSIFKSIKKTGLSVIIENENPADKTFDIGPIIKVTKNAVFIHYFNAAGILDNELTKINWNKITIIQFDDRYTNTFSKYLRHKKTK